MADEARIRVRLDTDGAHADLRALYQDLSNAPPVNVGARGGPAAVGIQGGGAGGAGGGGFAFGRFAAAAGGALAFGRGIARDTFSTFQGITQGISETLREKLPGISGAAAGTRGALRAQEQVMNALALGRGLGQVSQGEVRSLFDSLMQIEGPRALGESRIRSDLGTEVTENAGKLLFADAAGDIGDILSFLKERFGGGG